MGIADIVNCATTYSSLVDTSNLVLCVFNDEMQIVNSDGRTLSENSIYGVYSGENGWTFFECILLSNDKYYTINADLEPVEIIGDINDEVLFNNKFPITNINYTNLLSINPFKIIMVNKTDISKMNIYGIKENKQLVVANGDIITSIASNIDYIKLLTTINGDATIKIVLSTDKGVTWKSYDSTSLMFNDLNIVIPTTPYEQLTNNQKIQWDNAKNVILEKGITPDLFNTLNFNSLNAQTIRFAYVLSRSTYNDTAETTQLDWKFDAKGNLQKMNDSECKISVYDQQVKVQSLINNPIIKVNLMV